MKKNVALLLLSFVLLVQIGFTQNTKPDGLTDDFKAGYIVTAANEKLNGYIKESLKNKGTIVFVNEAGKKKTYTVAELNEFAIGNDKYASRSYDFYLVISSGTKASLYQKVTDNSGKLFNAGGETTVANTTEGKIGSYYLVLQKDNKLQYANVANFETVFTTSCADCKSLQDLIANKQIDFTQIVKAVETYNACN